MEVEQSISNELSNSSDPTNIGGQKQAACLNCRKAKTRCLRDLGDLRCKKCEQSDAVCEVPEFRVGRKKGIKKYEKTNGRLYSNMLTEKSKRDGLEKAVFRIEQELKRSKTHHNQPDDERNPYHLQTLLSEAQGLLPRDPQSTSTSNAVRMNGNETTSNYQHHQLRLDANGDQSSDDQAPFDDAENPLQLLARASDLSHPTLTTPDAQNQPSPVFSTPRPGTGKDHDLQTFFGPFCPSLDVEPESDPIEMGLVTDAEAHSLFTYFFENLAHTRWGVDPYLHTPKFLRRQSAFLFTSILAAAALFIPTAAALSKRLSVHNKNLARNIMFNRKRSPEIVLAFMVNIPWMAPGKHWSDDETCSYMAMALTIAVDMSLNKLIVPSPSDSLAGVHVGKSPSDCISARKALDLDGFHDVDPESIYGKRLLRRRERIWLALFVLDRGVCLARGRSFTVPATALVENCNDWHKSTIADVWDGSIVSSATLRRDLVDLISDVKKTCDNNRVHTISGTTMAHTLQDMIDGFFNQWYTKWAFAIGGMRDGSIPPYVEILVTHGRLSIYSAVVNHPTAPSEVRRYFRAAGLSSALNVLRAAVQGENRLKSMPNNTAIMISFAACFAFYLSTSGAGGNVSLAPSIRKLIEETADVLERIGTTPKHRNATSALYGRHLRDVIATAQQPEVPSLQQPVFPTNERQQLDDMQTYQGNTGYTPGPATSGLMQFSAMSDDQINEAITNMGPQLEEWPNVQYVEGINQDWLGLDWFNVDMNAQMW